MINAGEIPQIPGDMEVLAGHARTVTTTGTDFAATGQAVDTTWQGLAAGYRAPEAGQLFAATGPVRTVSASVGEDIRSVGAALAAYAGEVKEIKTQLASLKVQAEQFTGSITDDDWRDDQGNVDAHNGLLSAVNAQVAAFFEAQRKCANTINALYGGRQYRAENGDGRADDGEYGFTADLLNAAAGEDGALPWGSTEEHDRGFLGDVGAFFAGIGEGFVTMLEDLGALIGRDPETGQWSWGTAGQAWKGLGTFVYAVAIYGNPVTIVIDQTVGMPGMDRGGAGTLLLDAGKSIIAYDTWSEDKSKAAGLTTFNIVSAVVGTKGAGAGLRGTGTALNGIRGSATAARLSAGAIRAGNWLDNLPTVGQTALNLAHKFDIKIPNVGQLVPAFAGHGPPDTFHFDIEIPGDCDAGPMHMDTGPGPSSNSPSGNGPSGPGPSGNVPDGSTPGGRPPTPNLPGDSTSGGDLPGDSTPGGNLPSDSTPDGGSPGDSTPGGNLPGDDSPESGTGPGEKGPENSGSGDGNADRGRDLTPTEQQRFLDQAGRLRPEETVRKVFDNPEVPDAIVNQAVRDFIDLQDSRRLAGTPSRQNHVLRDLLDKLATTEAADPKKKNSAAIGAAAELRAAIDVINSPDLKPDSKIGLSVKGGSVDLGNGTVVRTGDVPEADLVYQTRDGKIHLDEVKATAQAVADKISSDPGQLDRMRVWRAADEDNRALGFRIGTDEGFTGLFSKTQPEPQQMAIDRIADLDVAVHIGGHTFTSEQLGQLRQAARRASVDPAHPKRGKAGPWFQEHMPNLDAARDFLRPYGVDFL